MNPSLAAVGERPGAASRTGPRRSRRRPACRPTCASMWRPSRRRARPRLDLRSADLAAIVGAALGAAAPDLPRTLLGVPVIVAPNSPAGQVVLADLAESRSRRRRSMPTSPTRRRRDGRRPTNAISAGTPAAPVATQVVSLYQTNPSAYKLSRFLNWAVVRDGAVATWCCTPAARRSRLALEDFTMSDDPDTRACARAVRLEMRPGDLTRRRRPARLGPAASASARPSVRTAPGAEGKQAPAWRLALPSDAPRTALRDGR